ncbi:redox-sensing transcriptional repressor Rex [uncultured Desulfobulbus sp.]|uniref:redox-sensing transcriptional repressor Rex n=1 Tax=uncultured Desulfobulbus sp. TaxID=239745 RepID=UPI0029C79548|nr:redox-sensing transcriptional repressor Rex [uncultured Desulfobulbus sp.]
MDESIVKKARNSAMSVPEPTLRRLPLYYRLLKQLRDGGRAGVSCTMIGTELKLDPTQIRKDIEMTGTVGRPKVGYDLNELLCAIERFLGWDTNTEAFLVGAGSLGEALMGYPGFAECGLNIVAAFDVDPNKCHRVIHGKHVRHISKLPNLMRRMRVRFGIITVPASEAQHAADLLVEGGVLAIWNFAPTKIQVPERIIVTNEDLYCSLAVLSQKMTRKLAESRSKGASKT